MVRRRYSRSGAAEEAAQSGQASWHPRFRPRRRGAGAFARQPGVLGKDFGIIVLTPGWGFCKTGIQLEGYGGRYW